MNKAHKTVLWFFVVAIIVVGGLYYYSLQVEKQDKIIFYYGNTCPHCKIVEDYMTEVNATSVLNIEMKEVYLDKLNAMDLQRKAEICGLNVDSLGVPLIYYNGTCYVGKDEALNILKQKMGVIV